MVKSKKWFSRYPDGKPSRYDDDIWTIGCVPYYNYTIIVHGYGEKFEERPWIKEMVQKFLGLRFNCIFFMDYSNFSSGGYFDLTPHFDGISAVLTKKILTIGNAENTVLFGFSFGARLVIDAGIKVAAKVGSMIDRIYACDPAGPGFGWYNKKSQNAAKFVECINTSDDKGTGRYDCHRNWRFVLSATVPINDFINLFQDSESAANHRLDLVTRHLALTVSALTSSTRLLTMTLWLTITTNVLLNGKPKSCRKT